MNRTAMMAVHATRDLTLEGLKLQAKFHEQHIDATNGQRATGVAANGMPQATRATAAYGRANKTQPTNLETWWQQTLQHICDELQRNQHKDKSANLCRCPADPETDTAQPNTNYKL